MVRSKHACLNFLVLIMFFFLFLGGFYFVPFVCFKRRVVVMGLEN